MPKPSRMKRPPDEWIKWTPVVLLIVVAMNQQYLAHFRNLTPWKGGGFGMFSTVDTYTGRTLFVYLITDEGEMPVDTAMLDVRFARTFDLTRALPHGRHVERFMEDLAEKTWAPTRGDEYGREAGGLAEPVLSTGRDDAVLTVEAIRLEVYRPVLDTSTNRVMHRQVASHVLEIDS